MTMSPTLRLLAVVSWGLWGCGASPPGGRDASTVRDSAGVRIVESVRGAWETPWLVDPQPSLSIGSAHGDPDQLLDQVTGAVGLPGGRIVVANAGSLELLFYDGDGDLLRRVGGLGGGPGEFQSLERLARYGADSILAVDVRAHRVSYFDVEGNFGRSVQLTASARIPFPLPAGVFGDGSLLATHGGYFLGGDPPVRTERTEEGLFRYEPDGGAPILLGSYPGHEWVIAPIGPLGQWERRGRPFGCATAYAAAGDRYYVADNATYEIRVYSEAARLIQLIRKVADPLPLEHADIQAFEDSVLAAANPRARRQMRVLFERLPPPPHTYPAYAADIRVDGDLNVWVREASRVGHPASEWSVFSATGELLGAVALPPGARVLDIGADYVVCLERDELDVEYVRAYRLSRGS